MLQEFIGQRPGNLPRHLFVIAACCGCLLLAGSALGQSFGTISGNITDPSGAAVPKAKVVITETGTSFTRTVTANGSGQYVIPNLRPTQYDLTVQATGFRKFTQKNITLLANEAATVDVRLQVGSSVQSVTVASNAVLVNTSTQTLNAVVGSVRMVQLPLNGRNAVQLLNLVPGATGVSPANFTSQGSPPGATNANINGSRDNQTSYWLDGANYMDQYYNVNVPFPFPDALQEFSVQTNDYSTRYGENAGGVVNVVTKSGTNQWHGDVFEFVKNPAFDSRNFFSLDRDQLKRNQFGGTIGGPVIIPHVYNGRNRTFFFFGYQGERELDVSTSHGFIPTPAELGGDFSSLLSATNPGNPFGKAEKIDNPWSHAVGTTAPGKAFPNNQIPASALDPAALKIANNYLPLSQESPDGEVFYTVPKVQNINEYILRVDQKLGDKDQLTGRWYRDHILFPAQNPAGNLLGYAAGYDQPVTNVMIQETHTFRPNLLNQASFTFSNVPTSKFFASNSPNAATFGVSLPWLPTTKWIQNYSVSGAFSIPGGAMGPFNNQDYGAEDNVSWVAGRHQIDIGATFDHSIVNLGDQYLSQGSFNFNATSTNNPLASFMLGYMNNFQQGYGEYKNNRNNFWAFYFNDSFHATRRLTLDYGLRYEPYTPWKEIQGRGEVFSPANFYAGVKSQKYTNAPTGLLFPGDPGVPFDSVRGNYTDFEPRVGFAYDLTGNGKTSIRGGAGFFYDSQTAGVINNRFADISPFSPQVSLTPAPGPLSQPLKGYTGYYPFPFTYPPASDTPFALPDLVITYDPSTKYLVPVTYQWDLAVERQLGSGSLLQVAYVGSAAAHEKETIQLDPCPVATTACTDPKRMFAPDYGVIAMDGQDVNSNFNALEVTFKKQMARNIHLDVAYTYSKALDDVPNGGNNNDINSDSASALPWFFPGRHQFDYGLAGFDHTHRLVVSYVWTLPTLSGSNAFVKNVLGSWEWTGIVTAQSGGPFTVTAGKDQSGTGLGQDRGVPVAGVQPFASNKFAPCSGQFCASYLNSAAFAEPAPGTFGTLGKDSFYGPRYFDWDMGVFKNFPMTERFTLQFRAELFNSFNTVSFNNPTSGLNSGGFGNITGASDPRIIQLALKLTF